MISTIYETEIMKLSEVCEDAANGKYLTIVLETMISYSNTSDDHIPLA